MEIFIARDVQILSFLSWAFMSLKSFFYEILPDWLPGFCFALWICRDFSLSTNTVRLGFYNWVFFLFCLGKFHGGISHKHFLAFRKFIFFQFIPCVMLPKQRFSFLCFLQSSSLQVQIELWISLPVYSSRIFNFGIFVSRNR